MYPAVFPAFFGIGVLTHADVYNIPVRMLNISRLSQGVVGIGDGVLSNAIQSSKGVKYLNVGVHYDRARQAEGKTYLVRTVVALVADADERARAHVGVADYALAIACVFSTATHKNIRYKKVVVTSRCEHQYKK